MSFLDYFRRSPRATESAQIAKERLQIIVAHERGKRAEYLPDLQRELLQVISKYVPIEEDQVKVALDTVGHCSILELNITLPDSKESEEITIDVSTA